MTLMYFTFDEVRLTSCRNLCTTSRAQICLTMHHNAMRVAMHALVKWTLSPHREGKTPVCVHPWDDKWCNHRFFYDLFATSSSKETPIRETIK